MNGLNHQKQILGLKQDRRGFTLVELLVAIAIFAVLSALGWKVFDHLIKVKDRNAYHEENLGQLQEAYLQFQRDALQIVPISANIEGQLQPALSLNNQQFVVSKSGVSDPLQQGISPFERIEYQYNAQEKQLIRLKYANINVSRTQQPVSSVILSDVEQFQISVLNPQELLQWPENIQSEDDAQAMQQLPRGLKVKFMLKEVEYEWWFSLLDTRFMQNQIPTTPSTGS